MRQSKRVCRCAHPPLTFAAPTTPLAASPNASNSPSNQAFPVMRTRVISTFLTGLTLVTSACGSPMNAQPDIKLNPHPVQRYEITVTTDAPGPFNKMTGGVAYEVSNVDCSPKDAFTGTRKIPNYALDFPMIKVDDNTYTGHVYLDQMQDEDYFGLGVCHWALTSAGAGFDVHGMTFGVGLNLEEIRDQKSVTRYFRKQTFLDRSLNDANAGNADSWPADSGDVAAHADAFFPVTVRAQRVDP